MSTRTPTARSPRSARARALPALLALWLPALLPLALAQPARAQTDEEALAAQFRRLDRDGDGAITRAEFPGSDRQFASMDRDRDGRVPPAEYGASPVGQAFLRARYRAAREPRPRTTADELSASRLGWLARADRNEDGKVTREEWTGTAEAFAQLDLDGNQVLDRRDRAEAEAAAPAPAPALPETAAYLPATEQLLRRFDKDRDELLSQRELRGQQFLLAALPFADADGDGALSARELDALAAAVARRVDERNGRRPEPYRVPFDTWDQDRDGKVRQNEWQGPRAVFDSIDLDRDAAVSREEIVRYERRVNGEDFVERFDLDGDGKVSAEEFAGPPGAFRRADRNGDGRVDRRDR